jgi:hypothetical protein
MVSTKALRYRSAEDFGKIGIQKIQQCKASIEASEKELMNIETETRNEKKSSIQRI